MLAVSMSIHFSSHLSSRLDLLCVGGVAAVLPGQYFGHRARYGHLPISVLLAPGVHAVGVTQHARRKLQLHLVLLLTRKVPEKRKLFVISFPNKGINRKVMALNKRIHLKLDGVWNCDNGRYYLVTCSL